MKEMISKKRNPDCCSEDEFKEFEERVRACIGKGPNSISVGEGAAYSSYWQMLNLSEYCGCRAISILEKIDMRDLWRWALSCGRLSPEQVRYIGEKGYCFGWSNLFDVVDEARKKSPEINTIFAQPFDPQDILDYMTKVHDKYVIAAGIKTNALSRDNLLSMFSNNEEWLNDYSVQMAIIKTKQLTQIEVIDLLKLHDSSVYHQVSEFIKIYEPRGVQLEFFIEQVIFNGTDQVMASKLWELALKVPNHGISAQRIANLISGGMLKISVPATASVC